MSAENLITIPARKGKAARVKKGQRVKLINTHGSQVVDTWAFNSDDLTEFMSMEYTRVALGSILPKAGVTLVTNRRRPILAFLEDTSPGIHDTLCGPCDRYRYEQLGIAEYHDNCTDNLWQAMRELGLTPPQTPAAWNVFMNIPVGADGTFTFEPPLTKPGDYVVLRAEMDCVIAFSACPQDVVPINGPDCKPTEAHFEIL
ncbi:MAG: urea carboxylase-associated family protein [Proteobacteria bacterium]|nr:urea carboxylase-associated family protein [Pseudomonadota bacterium]